MAVSKSELDEQQTREAAALEELIDKSLRKKYSGGKVIVNLDEYPSVGVKEELVRRYTETGWNLEFSDGQRLGSWVELS